MLEPDVREWAFGGSPGGGRPGGGGRQRHRRGHPVVGEVQQAVAVADDGERVIDDEEGDLCGHGTACAGIIRSIAPHCELVSVRVLGAGYTGSGGRCSAGCNGRWRRAAT